jgi:hypothetical protein
MFSCPSTKCARVVDRHGKLILSAMKQENLYVIHATPMCITSSVTSSITAGSPFQTQNNHDFKHVPTYGGLPFASVPQQTPTKLNDKSVECNFMDCCLDQKANKLCYDDSEHQTFSSDVMIKEDMCPVPCHHCAATSTVIEDESLLIKHDSNLSVYLDVCPTSQISTINRIDVSHNTYTGTEETIDMEMSVEPMSSDLQKLEHRNKWEAIVTDRIHSLKSAQVLKKSCVNPRNTTLSHSCQALNHVIFISHLEPLYDLFFSGFYYNSLCHILFLLMKATKRCYHKIIRLYVLWYLNKWEC